MFLYVAVSVVSVLLSAELSSCFCMLPSLCFCLLSFLHVSVCCFCMDFDTSWMVLAGRCCACHAT